MLLHSIDLLRDIATDTGNHGSTDTSIRTLELGVRQPEDRAVLEAVSGQGVPVVTVLVSGRVLYANAEINLSDAFVAAWLPGTEGGGIADVLFGSKTVAADEKQESGGAQDLQKSPENLGTWNGGPCRSRTYDQEITSLLLYQLS